MDQTLCIFKEGENIDHRKQNTSEHQMPDLKTGAIKVLVDWCPGSESYSRLSFLYLNLRLFKSHLKPNPLLE